jgi:hypothetical protein
MFRNNQSEISRLKWRLRFSDFAILKCIVADIQYGTSINIQLIVPAPLRLSINIQLIVPAPLRLYYYGANSSI